MKNLSAQKVFGLMAVAATLSFICFINIDSAFADKHNANGLFWAGGFISFAVFVWLLRTVINKTNK